MGILGVFLTAISGGIVFVDSCKNASEDADSRTKARADGRITYNDYKGRTRLVSTNEFVYTVNGKVKLLKTGQVVYDYKANRIKKQNEEYIAKAKAEGLKGCELIYPEFGDRRYYTEFSTGKRYYLKINTFAHPEKYYICYYTEKHTSISTMIKDWEDEKREVTLEEYNSYGGYKFCKDGQGIHYIEL